MPADKPTELSRIKLKTWTRQPVPMISEHSAHSTPQPFGIRTWLWRYTCLLLLISMLWHRQAIFESKGDKLSSSAESRIRTHQGLRHQIASRLNARWQTDWAIEDIHTYMLFINDKLSSSAECNLQQMQAIFESKGGKLSSSAECNLQQIECPLTNQLSYRGSSKNLN